MGNVEMSGLLRRPALEETQHPAKSSANILKRKPATRAAGNPLPTSANLVQPQP